MPSYSLKVMPAGGSAWGIFDPECAILAGLRIRCPPCQFMRDPPAGLTLKQAIHMAKFLIEDPRFDVVAVFDRLNPQRPLAWLDTDPVPEGGR